MPSLPLTYMTVPVGLALVDGPLTELSHLTWTVALPRSASTSKRPDVVLAQLREDPYFLSKCHPFTALKLGKRSANLRLSRIALRPQCIPLILRTIFYKENHFEELASLSASIIRVVHVDQNRCNCKLSNLREITLAQYEPALDDTTLLE